MASLSIRQLDDDIMQRLRMRAAHHQVSMEEEVRRILRAAVVPTLRLGDLAQHYFGATEGIDLELPVHKPHEPLSFAE